MIRRFCLPLILLLAANVIGCSNVDRSLIFFTNTNLGLELSVDTTNTSSPVKLVLGYKRCEGVLNPVYDKDGIEVPSSSSAGGVIKKYRDEAYSVLAKIVGDNGGGTGTVNGKLEASQWFATGPAATELAKHTETAAALTGNTQALTEAATYDAGFSTQQGLVDKILTTFDKLTPAAKQSAAYDKAVELKIIPDGIKPTTAADLAKLFQKKVTLYVDPTDSTHAAALNSLNQFVQGQ